MSTTIHAATLQRAADLLGGKPRLRAHLRVPMRELESWLDGAATPPLDVFLKAVDVISRPQTARVALAACLDAALRTTGAERGNVQLLHPEGLRIVEQRGFERPFLDFFACVHNEGSCGASLKDGRRVVVPDVRADPIFTGDAIAEIMAQANVRSVQSTPLIGVSGKVLGVLNTHREEKGEPSTDELHALDDIATRTAHWLELGARR